MADSDYYRILQVHPEAEAEVIEATYKRLARKYHPDVYVGRDANDRMLQLNLAYEVLINPVRRAAYDAKLVREVRSQAPEPQTSRESNRTRESKPSLVVSQSGDGHYRTINEAIRAAMPKTRIYVRPGVYNEALFIDKPIELVGDKDRGRVLIQSAEQFLVRVTSDDVSLSGLALVQLVCVSTEVALGLTVRGARLTIKDCDITSFSGTGGIVLSPNASATFLRCKIHDCAGGGMSFHTGGTGRLEDCQFFGNRSSQISIGENSSVHLSRCVLNGSTDSGISLTHSASLSLEDSQIVASDGDGIFACMASRVSLLRSVISDCSGIGMNLGEQSVGIILHSQIRNSRWGIRIASNASVSLEDSQIVAAENYGISVGGAGRVSLLRTLISDCSGSGIDLRERSGGIILRSQLRNNKSSGIFAVNQSTITVNDTMINGNGLCGVAATDTSIVNLENCDLTSNEPAPYYATGDSIIQGHGNRT